MIMNAQRNTNHILIVDDDPILQAFLKELLATYNYRVTAIKEGEMLEKITDWTAYSLVILDVLLPGKDGFYWIDWLNKIAPGVKVLMLSVRGEVDDRILGLESGANDYLPKPFDQRELLARINSLMQPSRLEEELIHFGDFCFNIQNLSLTKNKQLIKLTTSEAELLYFFCTHRFITVKRDQLSRALHGTSLNPLDRKIDVHICNLRQKLENNPANPKYIRTVWGKGYRFHTR